MRARSADRWNGEELLLYGAGGLYTVSTFLHHFPIGTMALNLESGFDSTPPRRLPVAWVRLRQDESFEKGSVLELLRDRRAS